MYEESNSEKIEQINDPREKMNTSEPNEQSDNEGDFDSVNRSEQISENFLRVFENEKENLTPSSPKNLSLNCEQFSEIETPDHLQNITVSDTGSVEDSNKLLSYDKLNLRNYAKSADLKPRKINFEDSETSEESSSEADSVVSACNISRKREREPSENSLSQVDSKTPKLSLECDFKDMTITLKLENEDENFFELINRIKDVDICPDIIVENHCLLKLSNLPKDVLLFLAVKFKLPCDRNKTRPVLMQKIKRHLFVEFPEWRKSHNGEYLFFASFKVQEQKSLYDLNVPELKTVCAAYQLDKIPGNSKSILQQFIIEQFEVKYPRHPKIKHEIIFLPDAPDSP
jgi:hypothetical protein